MENVVLNFGELGVLDNFCFKGETKQFICLFGPSGIGKTTILNLLAGILQPDYGIITLNIERVAYVFQEPRLPPWMTVAENIEVGLFSLIRDGHKRKQIVSQVLPQIGLTGFGEYYPEQLSGGMKQRVSIGRAFVIQPDLLLLDEPFSGLDENLKLEMQDLLLRLESWHMCTTVMVTHDIQEAIKLSDRIIVVGGRPCRILFDLILNSEDRNNSGYKNKLAEKIMSALGKNNKQEMESTNENEVFYADDMYSINSGFSGMRGKHRYARG